MKRRALGISASLALALAACGGGDDGGAGGAADEFTAICEQVDEGLDDLDEPTSVDEASSNARKIADLMEDAVDDMEKVNLGDDDNDAEDLIDNFSDQVDELDDLIAAAARADFDGLDVAIGTLGELQDDAADLAKDAGARKCAFKAVIDLVTPPDGGSDATTVPVETAPPVVETTPPVVDTVPPVVETTAPLPVDTTGGISDGLRSPLDLTEFLSPSDGSTFDNVPEEQLVPFDTLLSLSPATVSAAGTISGIDIISPAGEFLGRAFVFVAAGTLPDTVEADLLPVFDTEGVGVPTVFGPDSGFLLLRNGGAEFFAADPETVAWILGPDEASIRAAYLVFIAAAGG
jgi:hypothetical protein